MKYSRLMIAGSVLAGVALVLVVIDRMDPQAGPEAPADPQAAAGKPGAAAGPHDGKYSRTDRTREPSESPSAKELKLLWARGRGQELLVALDQLGQHADADGWREVAAVLVDQAARDGRHEVATYLLATGHGAPAGIRLAIYAAALENPDEGIRASAKLELLNLTGQEFDSRQQAESWLASHPEASREDEDEEFPEE
jgi:hypothetical protein